MSYPAAPKLFPAEPLKAIILAEYGNFNRLGPSLEKDLHRVARTGLSVWQADKWACRFGYHPAEIWPEWLTMEEAS